MHAGPASERPFQLAGERVEVVGSELGGVRSVRADGRTILSNLTVSAGTCANLLMTPTSLRRALIGRGGTLMESFLVPGRAAAFLGQWRPIAGPGVELDLEWRHDEVELWRAEGGILRTSAAGLDILAAVWPEPASWSVEADADRGFRVCARALTARPYAPVSLIVSSGVSLEDAIAALRAAARLRALEGRAEVETEERTSTRLALATGIREVDDALEWAKARIGALVERPPKAPPRFRPGPAPSRPEDALWAGFGALAAGEPGIARDLLAAYESNMEASTPAPAGDPLALLLLSQSVLWSGDPASLTERRDRIPGWIAAARARRSGYDFAALRALARAVEGFGDRALAADLRSAAKGIGVPLPSPAKRSEPAHPNRAAWLHYAGGRPDEGFSTLRSSFASIFREAGGAGMPRAEVALAPAALLFGMLGAEADAPFGRLRLGPAFPGHWTRLKVRNIAMGDAAIDLAYAREGRNHTFSLFQKRGAVPITLVFEPVLALFSPVRVFVDEDLAEVDIRPEGDRVRIRLQLPLDRARRIEIVEHEA